jgi:hypothetical protein
VTERTLTGTEDLRASQLRRRGSHGVLHVTGYTLPLVGWILFGTNTVTIYVDESDADARRLKCFPLQVCWAEFDPLPRSDEP